MGESPVDERDLTKLWYLAAAIVEAPGHWRKACDAVDDQVASVPLKRSLKALRDALDRKHSRPKDKAWLKVVAEDLIAKSGEPAKDAGRALAWALENASHHPRRAERVA
jgi:hypothetical protein